MNYERTQEVGDLSICGDVLDRQQNHLYIVNPRQLASLEPHDFTPNLLKLMLDLEILKLGITSKNFF
jgi:hypothetical protein